ncbi:hypothetical protein F511_47699 [Dorcoceras hygrometricum]|uniref:Uncharacterized protein n=1 Tax=Dorcoceras hygrometricum TaxID=472368 RepID=A0A2Z6ZQH7_9LAMI|nr:hypothetical protein F511_47699 [Dorcoceras hygrometricum]
MTSEKRASGGRPVTRTLRAATVRTMARVVRAGAARCAHAMRMRLAADPDPAPGAQRKN